MDEPKEKGLESLEVWQKSLNLAVEVCQNVLPLMPSKENWALQNQLSRSVQSIPANIAEGYGRYYYQDAVRFCYIILKEIETRGKRTRCGEYYS
jgi:four helix bundle protein